MVDGCESISNSLSIYGYNSNENLTPKLSSSNDQSNKQQLQQQLVNCLGANSKKYSCQQHHKDTATSSFSEESDPDHFAATTDESSFSYSGSSLISIGACGSSNEHFEEAYTGDDDDKFHHDAKFDRLSVTSFSPNKSGNNNNHNYTESADVTTSEVTSNSCNNESVVICDGNNCQQQISVTREGISNTNDETPIDPPINNTVRVPLGRVVTSLVNRWSLDYIQEAEEGSGEAMCLVAQMCLDKNGWGCVQHNENKGRYWLEKARSKGYSGAVDQLEVFYGLPNHTAKAIPKVSIPSNHPISLPH